MAETQSRQVILRQPGPGAESRFAPYVTYNPLADTLLIYFFGGPEPVVNVDVPDSSLYMMVDPDTYELVGVHIQAFRKRYLPEHQHFLAMEGVQRMLSSDGSATDNVPQDDAFPKTLAEMVVGSLIMEHGLRAA